MGFYELQAREESVSISAGSAGSGGCRQSGSSAHESRSSSHRGHGSTTPSVAPCGLTANGHAKRKTRDKRRHSASRVRIGAFHLRVSSLFYQGGE